MISSEFERLQHVELGYMEISNRPSIIDAKILHKKGNNLQQNGE